MSLLELIARRSATDPLSFSLPDLLAEEAMTRVNAAAPLRQHTLISDFFAAELVCDRPDAARLYARQLLDHGITEEKLLARYVGGAAESLGRSWEDDSLSFAQVTRAMGHLMEIAREIMTSPPPQLRIAPNRLRAFLARTPGEQHTLGLLLTAQQMRRRGWLVRIDLSGDTAALTAAFSGQQFDIIGFTASGEGRLSALDQAIRLTRRMLPDSKVVTGGWLGRDETDFAARVGADLSLGRDTRPVDTMIRAFALEDS